MKFKVLLEKDEDGWYVAIVPSLSGCVSQGKTEEALENIKEAIELHISMLAEDGIPIAPPLGGKRSNSVSSGMTKLPIVSGKEVIKALSKIGYYVRGQKGSHIHLRHPIRDDLMKKMVNFLWNINS